MHRASRANAPLASARGCIPPLLIKGKICIEATESLLSATLISNEKVDASGVERLARWKELGITPPTSGLEDSTLGPTSESATPSRAAGSTIAAPVTRQGIFFSLQKRLRCFDFASGGINLLRPLRPGSWVVTVYQGQLWLGQVKLIYLKGGGQKASHNFASSCGDISKLSRLVVMAYAEYGPLLTPLTAQLTGTNLQTPTYLLLHQENLVLSLDSLCQIPTLNDESIPLDHGLTILKPHPALSELWHCLTAVKVEIIDCVVMLLKKAAARPKKKRDDDGDDEEHGRKRPKTG